MANRSRAGGRKRLVLSLAAAAVFTVAAGAVTLSQLGGTANRPPTPIRSSRLAATTGLTVAPTKFLTRQPTRSPKRIGRSPGASSRRPGTTVASPASGSARAAPLVTQRGAAASTSPANPTSSYSSSSSTVRQALSPRPARPLRRQAAIRRTKANLPSGRTAASAPAGAPPAPSKETPVQCSRPSRSSATTPSLCSPCSSRSAARPTPRSAFPPAASAPGSCERIRFTPIKLDPGRSAVTFATGRV